MSIIDRLIYDRTAADRARLDQLLARAAQGALTDEEKKQLDKGLERGAYNYTDLNRVNEALRYLADRLDRQGGHTVLLPALPKWTAADVPKPGQLQDYLDAVRAVRSALKLPADAPRVPADMAGLTIAEANAIEQVLAVVDAVLTRIADDAPRNAAFMFFSGSRPFPAGAPDRGRTWAQLDGLWTWWVNWDAATWFLLLHGNLEASAEAVPRQVMTADGLAVRTADGKIVYVM